MALLAFATKTRMLLPSIISAWLCSSQLYAPAQLQLSSLCASTSPAPHAFASSPVAESDSTGSKFTPLLPPAIPLAVKSPCMSFAAPVSPMQADPPHLCLPHKTSTLGYQQEESTAPEVTWQDLGQSIGPSATLLPTSSTSSAGRVSFASTTRHSSSSATL